ncbi:MAG: hypothetical protein ACM3X7_07025 [Solirubrobacterales bacterium]
MNYENMLLILVAAASILQFYFTFLKGKSSIKSPGKEVYRLRSNGLKLKLLGLLFILILFYLIYAFVNSLLSYLGLAIVFYALLCILDFSKVNIITEKGIGTRNFYDKQLYNFILWENITEFEWSDRRATMLIYKYIKADKSITTDWEVCEKDKPEVEKLFKQHVKMKSNKNQS